MYFVHCRDRPGSGALRTELTGSHWSFMDDYADAMIARGPTLTADRTAATGSVHIVDLPDRDAVRVFAFDEPNYRAGVYAEVTVYGWTNTLGGTMWDFAGTGLPRFLVLGHGGPGGPAAPFRPPVTDRFIVCGDLWSEDGTARLGAAAMVEAPTAEEAGALLAGGGFDRVEVHPWQFGGRPQA